jgi:hypothetical protein
MSLIHHRITQGEPLRVGQREIVPEARVTWWMRRRATIRLDGASGWGGGRVSLQPTALIERGPGGERRIPIRDETARLLIGVAVGALFVYFLAEIAARLAMTRGGRQK